MKKILGLFLLSINVLFVQAQELTIPPNGNNQKAKVSQSMGLVEVTIAYSSPNVHGTNNVDRKGHIWGELIPYGMNDEGFGPSTSIPWRAGANENTTISFSHDVKIAGKGMKAGTYGLFLKIEKDTAWTWIFSKNTNSWGSFLYDAKEDVLRVDAQPEDAPYTEFLTYGFDKRLINSAVAYLQWENKKVSLSIEVPNYKELYVARMREDLRGWAGFSYQNWETAAQWCAANKINLDEALVWADKALTVTFRGASQGVENFSTLQTKATVLTAMGRNAEADVIMDKAVKHPTASPLGIFFYARGLLRLDKNEKAMEIFKYNQQHYPEEKFFTNWGLALGNTAVGDKKNAIINWETMLKNVPNNMKGRIPSFQQQLQKLKQ